MAGYQVGDEVLSGWKIVRFIDEGAFGKVYEVQKAGHGVTARSALKVVSIPPSESMVRTALSEGQDEASVAAYFGGIVDEFAGEVALVSSLKHPGIVGYQDHAILPHDDGMGYDVLLRMELLKPLTAHMVKGQLPASEVARLGAEIADVLAYCHARGVIHRDVKPGNVFTDDEGRYKLGDFGIARTAEHTVGALSRKGTEDYMAPEVYHNDSYGPAADIYSLGVMLYQLLNGNRLPFLPPAPAPVGFHDREQARARRLSSEALPPIADCDANLLEAVLAACDPDPARRPSAVGLRDLLNGLGLQDTPEPTRDVPRENPDDATQGRPQGWPPPKTETVGVWDVFADKAREAAEEERRRAEQERQERAERERLERERAERERQERAERERLERERAERERRAKEERERLEGEKSPKKPNRTPAIIGGTIAALLVFVLIGALSMGGGTQHQKSSGSTGGEVAATNNETEANSVSRVGDISSMDRAERAKLCAMVVTSRKVADGAGNYVDYALRDEDLARLVSTDSDLYKHLTGSGSVDYVEQKFQSVNYNDSIVSEQAFVMATKGDAYYVVADETSTVDDPDSETLRPEEIVVIFGDDNMVEHVYRKDDYYHDVLGVESQSDYMESYPISSEEEELSPAGGKDYVVFETQDFTIRLPGSWTLKRVVPSSADTIFGLENEGYYLISNEYHALLLEVGVETFNLESYGDSLAFCKVIGFSSSGKQIALWRLNDFPQDVQDYIVDNVTLL